MVYNHYLKANMVVRGAVGTCMHLRVALIRERTDICYEGGVKATSHAKESFATTFGSKGNVQDDCDNDCCNRFVRTCFRRARSRVVCGDGLFA